MPNPNKDKKSYNPKKVLSDPNFQAWYKFNTPEGLAGIAPDAVKDYDYPSFYGSGDYKQYKGFGHFPDTYKTPQHQTFSNESIYSTPENPGGSWNEDNFNPKGDFQYKNGGKMKKNKKYADGGVFPSEVKKVTKKQGLITTTEEVPTNLGYGVQNIQPLYPQGTIRSIPEMQSIPNPVQKKKPNSVSYEALNHGGTPIYNPVFHGDWTDKAKMDFYNSSPDTYNNARVLKGDSTQFVTPSHVQAPTMLPDYMFPARPEAYHPTYDMWGNDGQNYLPLLEDGGEINQAKSGFNLNPAHKGDCTPMSKSTCTGKKKQFAINAKNHFKKMPDGGDITSIPQQTPTKRSISYEPIQRQDHTMMYAPIFNGEWSYNDVKNAWNTIPDNFSGSPVVRGDAWNALYDGVKPGTTSSQWKRIATNDKLRMLKQHVGAIPRSGSWNTVNDQYEDNNQPQFNEQTLNNAVAKMPYGGSFDPYDFSGYDRQPWQDMSNLQSNQLQPIQTQPVNPNMQFAQQEQLLTNNSDSQADSNTNKPKKSGSSFSTPGTGDLIAAGLQMAANLLPEHQQSNLYHKRNFGGYNPNAYGTGSQAIYANGGDVIGNNLHIEDDKFTHISPNTIMINGDSHADGGTMVKYGQNVIEAEKGEPLSIGKDGNAVIWGNMKVPGTNKKFKQIAEMLGKQEAKNSSLKDKGIQLLNDADPLDSNQAVSFNTGKVLNDAASQKSKVLSATKEKLSGLQNTMLELAELKKKEPSELYNGIEKAGDGKTLKSKYNSIKTETEERLRALYPNSDIKVVQTGDRDIRGQRALKGAGKSKTSVSLHNFGGADDHLIYIDGKLINDPSVYKNTLWKAASNNGLYPLGDWDPGHISAVKEGSGHTITDLMKAYPELKGTDRYNNSLGYLQQAVLNGTADRQETYAYNQLTGSNLNSGNRNPKYNTVLSGKYMGETPIQDFQTPTAMPDLPMASDQLIPITPNEVNPVAVTPTVNNSPAVTPTVNNSPAVTPTVNNSPAVTPIPTKKPSLADRNKPKLSNFLGEIGAMFDQPDPVKAKHFQPTLFDPYQVSFQDKLNENQATFNSISDQLPGNASALSVLAAQKYQQDSGVLGEQFRTNQAISNDVTNKNVGLLNQAEQTNLGIDDQQYVRQSQAQANTRAHQNQAFASISDKLNQNRIENVGIRLMENKFDYRPDANMNMVYVGDGTVFNPGTGQYHDPTTGKVIQKVNSDGTSSTSTTYDPLAAQKIELAKKKAEGKWIK